MREIDFEGTMGREYFANLVRGGVETQVEVAGYHHYAKLPSEGAAFLSLSGFYEALYSLLYVLGGPLFGLESQIPDRPAGSVYPGLADLLAHIVDVSSQMIHHVKTQQVAGVFVEQDAEVDVHEAGLLDVVDLGPTLHTTGEEEVNLVHEHEADH